MAQRTFSEDLRNEVVGKTVMWVPAVLGGVLLGPVGIALGLITSVAVVTSGGGGGSPPPNGERPGQ